MVQTEKLIVKAFLALVDEKPLRSITVRDITDTCHINRNTFYYHFNSISSLIGYMLREQLDTLLFSDANAGRPEDYLVPLAQALLRDKKTILHIYRAISRDTLQREFPDAIAYAVSQYQKIDTRIKEEDAETAAAVYRAMLCGVLFSWLDAGLPPEIETMAKQMSVYLKKSS